MMIDLTEERVKGLEHKLDAILAVLLRMLPPEAAEDWQTRKKDIIVGVLLDAGCENEFIANITGLSYGGVANIKSTRKKSNKAKPQKRKD